jgi:copper oxidase (laccase) domain-containing protein
VRTVHWVRQVHGSAVVVVPSEGPPGPETPPGADPRVLLAGEGDALVSSAAGVALVVLTADCASIALGSAEGVMGAVHAGWRGLEAGVVRRAVEAMEALGASEVVGALGPCIHPGCYEFSEPDLDRVAAALGDQVRGRTGAGRPALDLPAAVSAALAAAGARQRVGVDACTGCSGGYFSHRARGDAGRQALVVWSSGGGGAR